MSSEAVRSLLVFTVVGLQVWAGVIMMRDRDRRERALRERPQPLRYTREAKVLTGLSGLALLGAALTYLA